MALFFADRDEGRIWCDRCVPAEVMLLAGEPPPQYPRPTKRTTRWVAIASGELHVGDGPETCLPVRARCHECGTPQPPRSA